MKLKGLEIELGATARSNKNMLTHIKLKTITSNTRYLALNKIFNERDDIISKMVSKINKYQQ